MYIVESDTKYSLFFLPLVGWLIFVSVQFWYVKPIVWSFYRKCSSSIQLIHRHFFPARYQLHFYNFDECFFCVTIGRVFRVQIQDSVLISVLIGIWLFYQHFSFLFVSSVFISLEYFEDYCCFGVEIVLVLLLLLRLLWVSLQFLLLCVQCLRTAESSIEYANENGEKCIAF